MQNGTCTELVIYKKKKDKKNPNVHQWETRKKEERPLYIVTLSNKRQVLSNEYKFCLEKEAVCTCFA
jgi:hypothetical protein